MARLRTFLAVGLGKSQRDRCVALQENLAQAGTPVNWVERDNLHVTLLFLGEIDEREIPVVCQAVATVAAGHAPFSLELEGVSGFPTPERPRTLYVNVSTGSDELTALYTDLEAKLVEVIRYRRETRPYVPHVTLGRPRRDEEKLP